MPSAQMIDFGPDPLTESMGKFASGFSDSFFKQQTQKKNEDIFQRIKESYGPDAKPDRIFRDILEAEGLDQDYKRDLLKEVKEYASLAGKKDLTPYQAEMVELRKQDLNLKKAKQEEETPITPFQQQNLKLQRERLNVDRQRLKQAADKNEKSLPDLVSKYTNSVLQNADQKMPAADKALLNSRMISNIRDDGLEIDAAMEEALDYINMKNQIVEEAEIETRPQDGTFFNTTPQKMEEAFNKAYQNLNQLYEAGIDSQRDLRNIAKRSGWKPEEITELLQAVYSSHGRKARTSKQSLPADKVTGSEQGMAQEVGGLDDILFGE